MMRRHLPEDIVNAKKQGFSSPDASWFKGESIGFVKKNLQNKRAPIYSFIEYGEIQKLLLQHFNGKENKRLLIWSLLYVNQILS